MSTRLGPSAPRRRGTVYLLVLLTVVLATVLVLAGLYTATSRRHAIEIDLDRATARMQAESGAELGVHLARNTMAWRLAAKASGVCPATVLGSGSFSVYASDPVDSDVANLLTDPVKLLGYGTRGSATQMVTAILDPDWTPMSSMGVAMCVNGTLGLGGNVRCIGAIACNGAVVASSATVAPDVYAVGTITGATYNGTKYPGSAAREMPVNPFDYYIAVGTTISYASTGGKIDKTVMGPNRNPFSGGTNAQGIYVIDCLNNDFEIRDSRIVGTLVLLNAGSGTLIRNSVFMESAVAGYPVLMVQGNLTFNNTSIADLNETGNLNYNPASTPYKGQSDTDTSDYYPTVLVGLVYVSGNFVVASKAAIDGGLIVGGSAGIGDDLTLYYHLSGQTAPPGFVTGNGFNIRNGSWARAIQ